MEINISTLQLQISRKSGLDNVLRVCLVSVSCSIIFQYCPLMVHLEELADQLVNGVGSLHLHVHGDKEGEKEENPAGEGQQLAGGELRVRPNLGQSVGTLSEGEDGGDRADDHDQDGEEEDGVEDSVSAGYTRNPPVADHKLLVSDILILTEFTHWGLPCLL